jgi:hypothetical protein
VGCLSKPHERGERFVDAVALALERAYQNPSLLEKDSLFIGLPSEEREIVDAFRKALMADSDSREEMSGQTDST